MICGKFQEDDLPAMLRPIGGPRYWCEFPKGHLGPCGNWQFGSQQEHVEAIGAALLKKDELDKILMHAADSLKKGK